MAILLNLVKKDWRHTSRHVFRVLIASLPMAAQSRWSLQSNSFGMNIKCRSSKCPVDSRRVTTVDTVRPTKLSV